MDGVKQHGADFIAALHKSRVQLPVMGTLICRYKANHIFRRQKRRALRHFIHDAQPFPDKAATFGANAFAVAGKG
jgi:hypothetical protein